ncbi:MAG TPA: DUF3800 domain-containing protein [Kiritimatiellia bacterium]|nr:DUF3800 domain-containing protein [Kiritimatiellia bacterium]
MHLVYIDDSQDESVCIFSALAIPAKEWQQAFGMVRDFRRSLKKSDGIYVYQELHAWKFVSGRGHISDGIVTKGRRCQIFAEALRLVAALPGARLFNAVFPRHDDERAFERLLNRINRTMVAWDSQALLICDQGKEADYTRLARKLHVYNPIPSQFGVWKDSGEAHRNIPIERIIEDPFFKDSRMSYLIQLVDFCAYALLRRERPLESKNKYGLNLCFGTLGDILVREANRKDAEGIIRP